MKYECNLEDGIKVTKLEIIPSDLWSLDCALAPLLHECILKFIEGGIQGAPCVDDSDVPDNLKSSSAKPKENEWDTDEFWFDRWNYVLQSMLYSFEQIKNGNVWNDYSPEYQERVQNGLTLFGKYFRGLWR